MDITNITQKYIKMSNMDITKKHNTEIYKDEQQPTSPKNITQKYIVMFFW